MKLYYIILRYLNCIDAGGNRFVMDPNFSQQDGPEEVKGVNAEF